MLRSNASFLRRNLNLHFRAVLRRIFYFPPHELHLFVKTKFCYLKNEILNKCWMYLLINDVKCRISHSVIWHHLQAHVKTFLSCFDANCFSASFVFLSLWTSLCAKSQNTKITIPFLKETIQYKSFQLHFMLESITKQYILSTAQVKYQHVNATSFLRYTHKPLV